MMRPGLVDRLRRRLIEANDHLEGVSEDVDFPWPGASKVTIGLAAGMARTLRAVFDRAVFPDNRPFAGEALGDVKSETRNKLEIGVNWLSRKPSNGLLRSSANVKCFPSQSEKDRWTFPPFLRSSSARTQMAFWDGA